MDEPWTAYDVREISGGYQNLIPEQFADRGGERLRIQRRVEAAQAGDIEYPLVEFYGVVGQGKSWLLSYLVHSYWFSNGPTPPGTKSTFSAKIDFDRLRASSEHKPLSLLGTLVAQIKEQLTAVTPTPAFPALTAGKELEEQTKEFTDFVVALLDRYVPILAFDATEKADEELLDWLETQIICPIIRTNRAIFVFGGRLWHRWKIFEVRRRVEPIELPPLDCTKESTEGTAELLAKLSTAEAQSIASCLYDYAFGHPLASKMIFDKLKALPELSTSSIDARALEANHDVIADLVRTRVVEERFFDELGEHSYLKELLWAVCILRKFNPTPLRHFTVSFIDGEYERRPGGFYLGAIRDMQATTLVQWNSAAGGYALDPVARKIMAKNLAMREPCEFWRRHQEAVRFYDNWIGQFPRNAVGFLIERTFHQSWALQDAKTPQETAGILVAEFGDLLDCVEKHPDVQWDLPDMAVALQEELAKDQELKAAIPKEASEKLEARAKQFHESFRGPSNV